MGHRSQPARPAQGPGRGGRLRRVLAGRQAPGSGACPAPSGATTSAAGLALDPDSQVTRHHEYERQLLNVLPSPSTTHVRLVMTVSFRPVSYQEGRAVTSGQGRHPNRAMTLWLTAAVWDTGPRRIRFEMCTSTVGNFIGESPACLGWHTDHR